MRALEPLSFLTAIEAGLPVTALEDIARAVAPDDSQFKFRLVPKATLTRRTRVPGFQGGGFQAGGFQGGGFGEHQAAFTGPAFIGPARPVARLSPEESARVARLNRVWDAALDVWGSPEAARAFLFRPHPLLAGRLPVDIVLATEFGGPVVENILGALKYGSAA